jgi:hypothetical protein
MRLNHVMNLWTQPRKDLTYDSQDSEQQNEEIKKLLHLGPYKVIDDEVKIRSSFELKSFINSC